MEKRCLEEDKIPEICKQCGKVFWRNEERKYCPLCKKDYRARGKPIIKPKPENEKKKNDWELV